MCADETTCRVLELLTADQRRTVEPDVDTPFSDVEDAVQRLLPYHIFQLPGQFVGKGKRKATEAEIIRNEISGVHVSPPLWPHFPTEELNGNPFIRNSLCYRMS